MDFLVSIPVRSWEAVPDHALPGHRAVGLGDVEGEDLSLAVGLELARAEVIGAIGVFFT